LAKRKVVVGMSGGVDSSVTAALLVEQGYEVIGVTLNLWPELEGMDEAYREDACCALGATDDARRVADCLDIDYYVVNFRDTFERKVIRPFVDSYIQGRTPNPCIECNRSIKYDALIAKAELFDADFAATGHYARIVHDDSTGRWTLRKAVDRNKDQSYVLYVMSQERLARTLFPLGEYTKEEVRSIAARLKLPVAKKPESQDICFVPRKSYGEFVERYAPEAVREGPIVDQAGTVLGTHRGIAFHTVGQRRGLGIATGTPRFVTELQHGTNTVVVGDLEDLYKRSCLVDEVNWVSVPSLDGPLLAEARIRYRAEASSATLTPDENRRVRVVFDEPQRAITPGQSVVFYHDDVVVGGGLIV
jgi:tRNA-specific 2-thiouridylase